MFAFARLKILASLLLFQTLSAMPPHKRNCLTAIRDAVRDSSAVVPNISPLDRTPHLTTEESRNLYNSTTDYQHEMRRIWKEREVLEKLKKDKEENEKSKLTVSSFSSIDFRKLRLQALIHRLSQKLKPEMQKRFIQLGEKAIKFDEAKKLHGFEEWLGAMEKRSDMDFERQVFELVEAEALIQNAPPKLQVDLGDEIYQRAKMHDGADIAKSFDLKVFNEEEGYFYQVEVKTIEDRKSPESAIHSFVEKAKTVESNTPIPIELAIFMHYPPQKTETKGPITEEVDAYGIKTRFKMTPDFQKETLTSQNLVLFPIRRSLESHRANGRMNYIFGIDALDIGSTRKQRIFRTPEDAIKEEQQEWERTIFQPN